MLRNKKIVLKYTPAALAVEILSAVLLAAILCLVVELYPDAPMSVPKSYSFFGAVSEWGARESALLHPILDVYVYLIVTGFGVIARRSAQRDNPRSVLSAVLMMLLCIKTIWFVYGIIRVYSVMLARDMPFWAGLVPLAGFGLTAVIGTFTIQLRFKRGRVPKSDVGSPG